MKTEVGNLYNSLISYNRELIIHMLLRMSNVPRVTGRIEKSLIDIKI